MKCVIVALLALLALAGAAMEAELTTREKRLERDMRRVVDDFERFVDLGVILRVVVADPDGEELLPDKPGLRMRVVREHGPFGGMLDTRADPPRLVGPSREPLVWYCSEDQETVLLHDDPAVPCQVIYGSEGAGKTRVLAMLHYFWWLELLGEKREAGQTAPTKKRTKLVRDEMRQLYRASWFRYNVVDQLLTFADGHRVQFVSTKRQSEEQGSPVQGYNWSRAGRDELQDQVEEDFDIESRGRSARDVFKQAATATAKPSSAFRTLVTRKLSSGTWLKRLLLIERSPFVLPSFLEEKRRVMTDREFRRRYKAEDLPPERMVYFNWNRERNLRPIPPQARKITSLVLRARTGRPEHALLAGHDPGVSKSATVFLDAYALPGVIDPVWWARAELFTRHKSTEVHAREVLAIARQRFGVNRARRPEILHVRAHPYGQSAKKPSLNVYRIFRRVGLDIRASQYRKDGTGTGVIPKDDRIEVVNTLLLDAEGRTRLYVEADAHGEPLCPRLVEAFETMERDDEGHAETEEKDENDLSDPPAALGHGVWPWEKESAIALRDNVRQEVELRELERLEQLEDERRERRRRRAA